VKYERRVTGPAELREPAYVTEAVANYRHRISVKLCHEYWSLEIVRLWLHKSIGPINLVVQSSPGLELEGNPSGIPRSVTFMGRATKRFLDKLSMLRPEFLGACYEAVRRVSRSISLLKHVLRKLA
jgi:hypothetical protein